MTLPHVTFLLPSGEETAVGPGGLIGRLATAALCIDDPRISEAHAMVSLRGGELILLALRGPLAAGRQRISRLKLKEGQRISLVPGIDLQVSRVELSGGLLAVRCGSGEPTPLVASVYTVMADPPRLEVGYHEGAAGHLWAAASGWRLKIGEDDPQSVGSGSSWEVAGGRFAVLEQQATDAGITPTMHLPGAGEPLTIVTRFETAHIHQEGGPSLQIPGIPARIISELASYEAPVPWEMVARSIWKDDRDRFQLRQNWDRHLRALRARLEKAGLRDDIVRPDGCGNIELFLQPGDRLVDES